MSGIRHVLLMARDLGLSLQPGDAVLDFGCGDGSAVRTLATFGYHAHGVDITTLWPTPDARFAVIEASPYRIPHPDASFRLVISQQVFEHVTNGPEALREVARVLTPDGLSIHNFPARWRPIEPHVFVPFATVFRPPWYLRLWAILGVRNEFQSGETVSRTVEQNTRFLRDETRYPTIKQIEAMAVMAGVRLAFVPVVYFAHHPGRTGRLARLLLRLRVPGAAALLSAVTQRAMVIYPLRSARAPQHAPSLEAVGDS